MKIHRLLVPALLFVLTLAVHGQGVDPFSRNQATTIKSDILDESRAISIYLPDNYKYSKTKYPVLYLLDEILHGTNTAERRIAARGVMKHLLAKGAIGAVSSAAR